jgi:hypothetical protein
MSEAELIAGTFELNGDVENLVPKESFERAAKIAVNIITSKLYRDTLYKIFGMFNVKAIEKYILETGFVIRRIRSAALQNCYGYVHRSEDPHGIYFNALLLVEMKNSEEDCERKIDEIKSRRLPSTKKKISTEQTLKEAESELQDIKDRHVIFLAVKLVSKISHLVNHSCNTMFKKLGIVAIPPKELVPDDTKSSCSDFGDIV